MTLYASLAETKAGMASESSTGDTDLLGLIRQVSSRVDRLFSKRPQSIFAPNIQARNNFMLDAGRINSALGTYYLGEPILALSGVNIGTQALAVATNVDLYQGDISPYLNLQLTDACCNGWYRYCQSTQRQVFITVTGTWGYNVDWNNAWLNTLQTVQNAGGISSSALSITVTDVDAANANGLTPALSAGNLIQIESEWLEVVATDTTLNTSTVRRGVNGSTAAAHAQGTAIYAYQVDEAIKRAVIKQTGLEYATTGVYEGKKTSGGASTDFAPDVLTEFEALLTIFANM